MGYQVPSAIIPAITRTQDRMKAMGLFKDKVDGKPVLSTWEAVEAALRELKARRDGTFELTNNTTLLS